MYEGRTRGKRMRYTYDEAEDEDEDDNENFSDATSNRRSARQSGRSTPADVGPQYTASGRQVKPRQGGEYGASLLSRQAETPDDFGPDYSESKDASDGEQPVRGGARAGRATRGAVNGGSGLKKRKRINDDDDDEGSLEDMSDDAPPSGEEWDSQANDDADDAMPDADEDSELLDDEESEPKRLVVTLKTNGKARENGSSPAIEAKPAEDPAAAGALKAESTTIVAVDGAQLSTTHLQVQDADLKQTEYPTPTSTVAATTIADKPSAPNALKPQQSGHSKPAGDLPNGTTVTGT
jgi:hypothetical protein